MNDPLEWSRPHNTLERILKDAWAIGLDVQDIIVQDEYSHDVLLPLPDGRTLVYDTT